MHLDKIDLRGNRQLKSLVIHNWFESRFLTPGWSLHILNKIRSLSLESLTFRYRGRDMELLPWSGVDEYLNKDPFPNIKEIRFQNGATRPARQEEEYLKDRLPGLVTKGILRYEWCPEGIPHYFPWRATLDGMSNVIPRSSLVDHTRHIGS